MVCLMETIVTMHQYAASVSLLTYDLPSLSDPLINPGLPPLSHPYYIIILLLY